MSCSIHSTSNASIINMEVLDLRLSSNNGICTQSIILEDGNKFINVTCNNNTDFIKGSYFETNTSCLNLTLSNTSDDGYFWFKFTSKTISHSLQQVKRTYHKIILLSLVCFACYFTFYLRIVHVKTQQVEKKCHKVWPKHGSQELEGSLSCQRF